MTTNQRKAAKVLLEKDSEESLAVALNHDAFLRASEQRREDAQALADADLITPDLPPPTKILDDGSPMWNVNDSSIGVDNGLVYIDGGLFTPEAAGKEARAILAAAAHATQEKEMGIRTIYDMSPDHLEKEIVGKTITSVDTESNTITLSNGTVLEFKDTSRWRSWFSAELKVGNLTDNAVTSIEVTDHGSFAYSFFETDYTIHVLSDDTKIVDVMITGDTDSGNHCYSVILNVKEKK